MWQSWMTCLSDWAVQCWVKGCGGCAGRLRELWEAALAPPEPEGTNTPQLLRPGRWCKQPKSWEALPYVPPVLALDFLCLNSWSRSERVGKACRRPAPREGNMFFLLLLSCSIYKQVISACWRRWRRAKRFISCLFFETQEACGKKLESF